MTVRKGCIAVGAPLRRAKFCDDCDRDKADCDEYLKSYHREKTLFL